MKLIVALAALLLLPAPISAGLSPKDRIKESSVEIKLSMISVMKKCKPLCIAESDGECSGVIVGSHGNLLQVMTAEHCVSDSSDDEETDYPLTSEETAITSDGDRGKLTSLEVSYRQDIAVATFAFQHPHRVVANLFSGSLRVGRQLYAFGNPPSGKRLFQDAKSLGDDSDVSDYAVWSQDYAAKCRLCGEGDSGGGIWTTSGELVGIMNAAGDGIIYYLPISKALQYSSVR